MQMVVLSDADSNLWAPLLEQTSLAQSGAARRPERAGSGDTGTASRILRPQAVLSASQVDQMVALYGDGATV